MSQNYSVSYRKKATVSLADNETVSLWDPDSIGTIGFSEGEVVLNGTWKVSAIGNFLGSGLLGRVLIRPFFMKAREDKIAVENIEQLLIGKTKFTGSKAYHIFQVRDGGMSEVHVFTTSEGNKIESHFSTFLPKEKIKSEFLSAMGCSEKIGNGLIVVEKGLWECKNCHTKMLLAGDFCSKCRDHKKDIAIRKE